MPPTIPKRLKKEPAIEAVWQCFFDGQLPLPVAEMMVGILYRELRRSNPA
ncbi:MAG: hypothetical protein NZ960_08495 [Candidatus Kapabacteria bacterium]|nr:hypothetical protein [Candidatus Kapabacteria bacterium]MDW8012021.1 hypothetical protein [Bacteroidota bacterium]